MLTLEPARAGRSRERGRTDPCASSISSASSSGARCRRDAAGDRRPPRVPARRRWLDRHHRYCRDRGCRAGPADIFHQPEIRAGAAPNACVRGDRRRPDGRRRPARSCAPRNPTSTFARAVELFADPLAAARRCARAGAGRGRCDRLSRREHRAVCSGRRGCQDWRPHDRPPARQHRPFRRDRRRLRHPCPASRSASASGSATAWSSRMAPSSAATASASRAATDGSHHKIPQIGGVVIEDDVEIGANTTVDRPAVGQTRIGGRHEDRQSRADRPRCSHRPERPARGPGRRRWQQRRSRIRSRWRGRSGSRATSRSARGRSPRLRPVFPTPSIPGAFVSGYPAIPNRDWLKASALFRKLPELRKLVSDLERRIAELEAERNK